MSISSVISHSYLFTATYDLLGYIGVQYKSIVVFVYFLIAGLGVDDSFLMMHALHQRRIATDKIPHRIAFALQQVCKGSFKHKEVLANRLVPASPSHH